MKAIETNVLTALLDKNEDVVLVNTLATDSFERTRIPKSVNIPLDANDFVTRVEKLAGGKNKPVVVYCANEQCDSSEKAAEKLENAGFTQVIDFAGGFQAWQEGEAKTAEYHSC